jgi:predicted nucleic acid-binding protein
VQLVVDTSVIISVITNESNKPKLINITKGFEIIAPHSLHWEVGNAISAMFKRRKIDLNTAMKALEYYGQININFVDVDLPNAVEIAETLNLYAYDAYFLECSLRYNKPLLSLDTKLIRAAKKINIETREV